MEAAQRSSMAIPPRKLPVPLPPSSFVWSPSLFSSIPNKPVVSHVPCLFAHPKQPRPRHHHQCPAVRRGCPFPGDPCALSPGRPPPPTLGTACLTTKGLLLLRQEEAAEPWKLASCKIWARSWASCQVAAAAAWAAYGAPPRPQTTHHNPRRPPPPSKGAPLWGRLGASDRPRPRHRAPISSYRRCRRRRSLSPQTLCPRPARVLSPFPFPPPRRAPSLS